MNVAVVPDDARDRPEQHVREVDRVAEQVGRDAVAALVELEAPRQQPERVAAVHREEAAAVVGDLAELAASDQVRGVAHERRPAVVVAHAGDHARAPRGALGAHGLLRRAADRLLAEDVLAGLRGGLDQLDVDHVRRRDVDDLDRRVVDHPPPVLRRRARSRTTSRRRRRARAPCRCRPPARGRSRAPRTASRIRCSERLWACPSQPKPITPTPTRRRGGWRGRRGGRRESRLRSSLAARAAGSAARSRASAGRAPRRRTSP